jgi:hypothetical protein
MPLDQNGRIGDCIELHDGAAKKVVVAQYRSTRASIVLCCNYGEGTGSVGPVIRYERSRASYARELVLSSIASSASTAARRTSAVARPSRGWHAVIFDFAIDQY